VPVHLLFVCIENSCRSQMAEAFAKILGGHRVSAQSAGSQPSGAVHPKAIEAMRQVGYDLTTHRSKSLDDIPVLEYDAVVTMGCGDACPFVRARFREDWKIPDPKNLKQTEFNAIRDMIRRNVSDLLLRLPTFPSSP
jgi:protein-tyrosine-phosphatase